MSSICGLASQLCKQLAASQTACHKCPAIPSSASGTYGGSLWDTENHSSCISAVAISADGNLTAIIACSDFLFFLSCTILAFWPWQSCGAAQLYGAVYVSLWLLTYVTVIQSLYMEEHDRTIPHIKTHLSHASGLLHFRKKNSLLHKSFVRKFLMFSYTCRWHVSVA